MVGEVRETIETNIARAKAAGRLTVLLDDTRRESDRVAVYAGEAGQTRFQRGFTDIHGAAAKAAVKRHEPELAAETETIQFRDLRRPCVVYLGELGLDAHLISGVTGHDIDEAQCILKVYMARTTGRAARAIAFSSARQPNKRPLRRRADRRTCLNCSLEEVESCMCNDKNKDRSAI